MNAKKVALVLVAIAVLMFPARPASAVTIYSTLGSFDPYSGSMAGGTNHNYIAATFTPSLNYTLDSITIAAHYVYPVSTTHDITLSLTDPYSSSVYESFQVNLSANVNSVVTATSVTHPALSTGTEYWVVASGPTTTIGLWGANTLDPVVKGRWYKADTIPDWTYDSNAPTPSFRVEGTLVSPVPIPGAVYLFGSGLVGLVGIARWRRRR